MAKNLIHIFGASGSGTTTLAEKISRELGYFHLDTDDYFWLPTDPKFTAKRPVAERLQLMHRDMDQAENAVISGSLTDWGDPLIPEFTLAVRIEMDPELRLQRLLERERLRYGSRIEPGGDMYKANQAFLEWAKSYDTGGLEIRSKAKHDQWQTLLPCPILLLDGGDTLENNFQKVLRAIPETERKCSL